MPFKDCRVIHTVKRREQGCITTKYKHNKYASASKMFRMSLQSRWRDKYTTSAPPIRKTLHTYFTCGNCTCSSHGILISSAGWNVSIVTPRWWFALVWGEMARWQEFVEGTVWSWEEAFSCTSCWVLQKKFKLDENCKTGGVYVDWNAALPVCGITGASSSL